MHFHTDDLDATFERLQTAGAEIVQEPTFQPWGARDCAVRDPSGNLVRIDQPPTRSVRGARPMKTMTCRQLGGPCDLPHRGMTADEVIKAQDRHLNDAVANGDAAARRCFEGNEGQVEASRFGNGLVQEGQA